MKTHLQTIAASSAAVTLIYLIITLAFPSADIVQILVGMAWFYTCFYVALMPVPQEVKKEYEIPKKKAPPCYPGPPPSYATVFEVPLGPKRKVKIWETGSYNPKENTAHHFVHMLIIEDSKKSIRTDIEITNLNDDDNNLPNT